MKRSKYYRYGAFILAAVMLLFAFPQAYAQSSEKPNVILMLSDNVGYGDIGAFQGGEIRGMPTPRIDQLASDGLTLTQFMTEPGCTPSRAGLQTGRYAHRSGLGSIIVKGSPNTLQPEEITLAEIFKSQGYATAMTGKWHLGADEKSHPVNQGYDEYRVGVLETSDSTLYRANMERAGLPEAVIKAGVPQGTKVGPILFVIMINDLTTCCNAYKYVDDTTLVSSGSKGIADSLQLAATEANAWSQNNHMAINPIKTKELLFSFSKEHPGIPPITLDNQEIDSVKSAKLLGVTLSADLRWECHISNVYNKAVQRVHYITLLRRAGIMSSDLVKVYLAIIRPTMEYACQVWHPGLTQEQCRMLESIQKRVLRVIHPDKTYQEALECTNVPLLRDRREELCKSLFEDMTDPSHKMHHLVPPKRQSKYITRNPKVYSVPVWRTDRPKKTFMTYALTHFQ